MQCDLIRVKGYSSAPWAIRITIGGKTRYRFYHYKKEAIVAIQEWKNSPPILAISEFNHKFDSVIALHIEEVK